MKNWIISIKKPLLNILFAACFTLLIPVHLFAGQMPNSIKQPAAPELTPEQIQQIEEFDKQMREYVQTLPPEEQEAIAQLEQKINNMSDEELEALFDEIFSNPEVLQAFEEMAQEQPGQPEPAEPIAEPIAKPIEKPIEKPKVEKNKLLQAAEMIKSLSDVTEAFLAKIDSVPEIDDVVRNWIKKHQIRGWKQNAAWHDIKAQIDLFNQKLKKMLQKDPGTNEYRFLPDLIKEESIYNNLAHMESVLKVTVPKIEVAVFGHKKLSKESKAAMRSALNKYAEGMSDLQLIPSMNSVIEKHEPIAKQLREKEAALTKTALEESKKPRTEKSMVTAGKAEPRPSMEKSGRSYDDSTYYPNSYYPSSYAPSYSPEVSSPAEKKSTSDSAGASKGGSTGKGGGAGKAAGAPDKGGKPIDKAKDGGKEKGKDKAKEKDNKKDDKKDDKKTDKPVSPLQKKLETVEATLKDANKASGDPLLINMRTQLVKPGAIPAEVTKITQQSISKINAATAAINDLGKELATEPDSTKKEYSGKVKAIYNKNSGNIKDIEFQLEYIKKDWSRGIKPSAEKRQAYGIDFDVKKPATKTVPVETNADAVPQEVQEALEQMQAQGQQAGRPADEAALVEQQAQEVERLNAELQRAQETGNTAQEATLRSRLAKAESKKGPENPTTLDAAIAALKQSIENLTK